MEELTIDEQELTEQAEEAKSESMCTIMALLQYCCMIQETTHVMFQCSSVELTGECVESTGVVVKNVSASWSSDREKVTISNVSFQVDQVCTLTV